MTQEFKSIEEIKEEVAKQRGFKDWHALFTASGIYYLQNRMYEITHQHSQQYIDANKELVEMLERAKWEFKQFRDAFGQGSLLINEIEKLILKHNKQ